MKKILLGLLGVVLSGATALAQTNTPTNTPTSTPTPIPASVAKEQQSVTLSVAIGSQRTNAVQLSAQRLYSLTVLAPAAIDGTVTVEVSDTVGGTYRSVQLAGADINVAAGKAVPVRDLCAGWLTIKLSVNATAQRDFVIYGFTATANN